MILASTIRPQPFRSDFENNNQFNQTQNDDQQKQSTQSFAHSLRKSLLNHSLRKMKKRKTILDQTKTNLDDLIKEDGALSTENGDLAILLEFDLDSNLKFVPYRTELNNLINSNLTGLNGSKSLVNSQSMTTVNSNQKSLASKSISFINQFNEQLPKLLLQRIAFCNKHSDEWRQQIKLTYEIIPKPPPLRSRTSNEHNSNSIRNHKTINQMNNNNNLKRTCECENCQLKRINGLKEIDCKMPIMDNILLRANEFNTNLSMKSNEKQTNSKLSQILNR